MSVTRASASSDARAFGGGLVIAPNHALTLAEVPVHQAGTASGLLQTGQRVGAAIGIAAVGSAFFAAVASSHGNFARGFERGITVAVCFVAAALLTAIVDITIGRRKRSDSVAASRR
jgi:hypothetical protein